MREICTSGSTRGQWVAVSVAHCPTLPVGNSWLCRGKPAELRFSSRTARKHLRLSSAGRKVQNSSLGKKRMRV